MDPAFDPPPPAPSPTDAWRLPIRFVGSGSEYFRIWIVNLLLTIVTLGLYYPYAKVRRLRYFHGATEVGGHPLSFHGEPKKMLRGYLLVAGLLVLYSIAGRVSDVAGAIAFVIVAALWPALWHSSMRFRLANTGWMGLRGRFTGSLRGAYQAFAPAFVPAVVLTVYGALVAIGGDGSGTVGLATGVMFGALLLIGLAGASLLPWTLKRYQHAHYAYAGEQTRVDVPLRRYLGLMSRGAFVALGSWLLIVLLGVVAGYLAGAADAAGRAGGARAAGVWLTLALGLGAVLVYQVVLRPWMTARLQNLWWNGTRSEHFRVESALHVRPLLVLSLANWLLIVITLGLYYPFALVRTTRLRLESIALLSTIAPQDLVAGASDRDESAAGDAAGDLLGIDFGF